MSDDRRARTVFPFPPEYRASGVLVTVKKAWNSRVTTVFPRQGQYAHERNSIAVCPPADLTVERIGDLLHYDLSALLADQQSVQIS